jgi:hypothetical protein
MTFFFTHWFNYKGAAFGSLPPHTSAYTAFMTFFFTHWFNYKGAAFGSLPPHTSEPLSPQGLFYTYFGLSHVGVKAYTGIYRVQAPK